MPSPLGTRRHTCWHSCSCASTYTRHTQANIGRNSPCSWGFFHPAFTLVLPGSRSKLCPSTKVEGPMSSARTLCSAFTVPPRGSLRLSSLSIFSAYCSDRHPA